MTDKPTKDSTRTVGRAGEDIACQFLSRRGYHILDRNWQIRGGELDIIAECRGVLVFIEVKARFSHDFGLPVESITPNKVRVLKRSAHIYIHQNHLYNTPARFDLVSIDYVLGNPKIELIENII